MHSVRWVRALRALAPVLFAASAAGACGDDGPAAPTAARVAGSYEATTLTASRGGQTLDLLSEGAEIFLELAPGGTTNGLLFLPEWNEDGSDLEVELDGTWTLSGRTVDLALREDIFLGDISLTVRGNQLTAQGVFEGATVNVVLTKLAQD